MIKAIKKLFRKRDRSYRIVFTFTPQPDGKFKVRTESGYNIPATHAMEALENMRWAIGTALTTKCRMHGFDSKHTGTRAFQKKQRIGDLR